MVEISPPAGWAPPPEVAAILPLTAAAAHSASPVALSPVEYVTAAAVPASKSLGAMSYLIHSTAAWWSVAGVVMLAAAGLGASIALRGTSESTPPIQLAATPVVAALAETQSDSGVCQGLVAAMDEQSKLNLPNDDDTEKVVEPDQLAGGETSRDAQAEPALTISNAAVVDSQNDSTESMRTANFASSPAEPSRTLKLEPLPSDSTATSASAIGESLASSTLTYTTSRDHGESNDVDSQNIAAVKSQAVQAPHPLLRFGPWAQDAAHRTNIADQVALPIKSFDMSDASLSHVLETLANLAAVPITVDPAVLSAASVSPDAQVTVHDHDTTVGKLIGTVLRNHNLACKLSDGQFVVEARSAQQN